MAKFLPGTPINSGIIERMRRRRGAPTRVLVRAEDGSAKWVRLPVRKERLSWRIGDRFQTKHLDVWTTATIVGRQPGTPPRFHVRYDTGESYWTVLPQVRVGDEWLSDPNNWK